jgi:2-phosphosulfolactate phosphatase
MTVERPVHVHLSPELAPVGVLAGGLAVVIDVLRATTTIVYALAAGCTQVRTCADLEEARRLANSMRAGKVLLGGERGGVPLPDFDLGNSPGEYTCKVCKGTTLVFTTSNGTKALERATEADRVLVGAFVNFSAACEQIRQDPRPIHFLCAGKDGAPALDDTLLAGAFVDFLCDETEVRLNDSARLAWDSYENHGQVLAGALEISASGTGLHELGYGEDLRAAAEVDKFNLVPELRRDPLRIEVGAVGIVKSRWQK